MHIVTGIIASVLLISYVSTSQIVEQKAAQDILEGEEEFVNSLELEQQKWWSENRQKVFDLVVNAAIGVNGELDLSGEATEEIGDFIKSLNTTQRKLWSKLRAKADRIITKFIASPGTHHFVVETHSRAKCGGGCIFSSQCVKWAGGDRDCRCTWFTCG